MAVMTTQQMREMLTGGIKKYPRWVGKRNIGLDVKRRERELDSPNADAVRGPARMDVRRAEGVARARMGWSAVRVYVAM